MSKRDDLALLRRRKQSEAIDYAHRGDWRRAVDANADILSDGISADDIEFRKDANATVTDDNEVGKDSDQGLEQSEQRNPMMLSDLVALSTDTETLNRLAKAIYEDGNVEFARQIYQRVLSINENNPIAKRMISLLDHTDTRASKNRRFADMRTFVVETGKSTITTMHIDQAVAIALVPGEIVEMRIVGMAKQDPENENQTPSTDIPVDANAIDIYDTGNTLLGRLEPRLAQRIIDFMRQGNQYIAVVWRVSEHYHMIDLVIRESYRNPDLTGSVSFPGKLNDEEKSALIDPIDEDIDDPNVDDVYALDSEEETPRLSSYDDDDDNFDGGDDNAEDEVDDFAPKKGKAGGRASRDMSLDDVQRDETRKNTDRDAEDE